MERKKHNLHSTKADTIQIPLQLHLSDYNDFVTNLLGAEKSDMFHQDSDSSLSGSDLVCEAIIHFDSDDTSPTGRSFDHLEMEIPSKIAHDIKFQKTQSSVNEQILSQLTAISDRLKKMGKKPVKKTNNMSKIKGNHAGIEPESKIKGLQQLAKTSTSENKIKSQRGSQVDVFVKNRIKWPHEYVLAGSLKERVSYDQLTMGQWMAGFCRTMIEESCIQNKNAILDYLISLLDDSNDFS